MDGDRVLQRAHESTQLPFELEIFNDIGFTEKHTEPIDIGPLSDEIQTVYIQAKVSDIFSKIKFLNYCNLNLIII